MKCFADFGDTTYFERAVAYRVVFAKDTQFDQAGNARCNENFNLVDEAK